MEDNDILEPTYLGKFPFEVVITPDAQQQGRINTIRRALSANSPYRNFSKAQDFSLLRRLIYKKANIYKDKKEELLRDPFTPKIINYALSNVGEPLNCINTASYWVTGDKTVANNQNLYNNPEKYGYKRITKEEARPGDLTQYTLTKDSIPYHAGIIVGKDTNTLQIKSSTGKDDLNPIRTYINDVDTISKTHIKNNLYYRYNYPDNQSNIYFIKHRKGGRKSLETI